MQNQTNSKLLRILIQFDFFLFESNLPLASNLRISKKFIKKNKITNKNIFLLDPYQVTKNLKQIFRVLQYFSNAKSKKKLNIIFGNEYYLELFETLVKKKTFLYKKIKLLKEDKTLGFLKKAFCFFVEINKDTSFYKKLFFKNNLLISEISTNFKKEDLGSYKIINNIEHLNKIVFFFLMIKKIYKKKNAKNSKI